jgi:hypothetical protein
MDIDEKIKIVSRAGYLVEKDLKEDAVEPQHLVF